MRDAQTLLDQIVAYGGQRIEDDVVAEILDLVDRNLLKTIVLACIDGDPRGALEHLSSATAGGSEAGRIAAALLELLRDLTVLQIAPEAEGLFEGTDEEREELRLLGARCEPARLRRMFRALVREIEDLSFAPTPSAVLEMAVIRLATMPAGDDVEKLLARLDQLERRLSTAERNLSPGAASAPPTSPSPPSAPMPRAPMPRTSPTPRELPRGVRELPTRDAPRGKSASHSSPQPAPLPTRSRTGSDSKQSVREEPDEPDGFDGPPADATAPFELAPASFDESPQPQREVAAPDERREEGGDEGLLDALDDESTIGAEPRMGLGSSSAALFDRLRAKALEVDRARHASLEHAEFTSAIGSCLRISVATGFHVERVRSRVPELETLAQELFGHPMRIQVDLQAVKTPAQESAESRERSRRRRQEALNSEPVNLAIEILDAEIVEIRPLGENR